MSDTTLELDAEDLRARVRAARGPAARVLDHGGCSRRGEHRDENQDAFDADGRSWFVVADGMGGHEGGRLAAQSLVEALRRVAASDATPSMDAALEQLGAAVRERAAVERLEAMGTTLVLLHVTDVTPPVLVHLGDSRAYLWRDGQLQQLTRDHTVRVELQDAGGAPEDLEARGIRLDALTGYVGGRRIVGEPTRRQLSVLEGDRVLLCTDGVHGPLDDEGLAEVLAGTRASSCAEAAEAVVDRALSRGGRDNATAVVVDLGVGA